MTASIKGNFDEDGIITLNENYSESQKFTFAYSDGEVIDAIWSISGDDSELFTINSATGELFFNNPPDWENPTDKNRDNKYSIDINANVNNQDFSKSIQLKVDNITDENEFVFNLTKEPLSTYSEGDGIYIEGTLENYPYQYIYYSINVDNIAGSDYGDINASGSIKVRKSPSGDQYLHLDGFSETLLGSIRNDGTTEGEENFTISFYDQRGEYSYSNDRNLIKTYDSIIQDTSLDYQVGRQTITLNDATIFHGLQYIDSKRGLLLTREKAGSRMEVLVTTSNEPGKVLWGDKGIMEEYDLETYLSPGSGNNSNIVSFDVTIDSFYNSSVDYDLEKSDLTATLTYLPFPYSIDTEYSLELIKDYDGNLHANNNASDEVKSGYKYQGYCDLNNDGFFEAVYTNKYSGRWASAELDTITGQPKYSENGSGGITRVVGIYDDPLIAIGLSNGGYLSDGVTPAPAQLGATGSDRYTDLNGDGDTDDENEDRLALNSQVRFQRDLENDNLQLIPTFQMLGSNYSDLDGDGMGEIFWKTRDGDVFLRSIHHFDGNIQYANYMSETQFIQYAKNSINYDSDIFIGLEMPSGWDTL